MNNGSSFVDIDFCPASAISSFGASWLSSIYILSIFLPSLFCVLLDILNIVIFFFVLQICDMFLCVIFECGSILFLILSTSFHNKLACLSSFEAQTISIPPSPILKSVCASAAISVVFPFFLAISKSIF